MKIYNVLSLNKQDEPVEKQILFIEESFSFTALCFQSLWFLYYKMWLPALTILFAQACLLTLLQTRNITSVMFVELGLVGCLLIAFFANTWRINDLKNKNYKSDCIIAAKNLDEAKLRFYQLSLENI